MPLTKYNYIVFIVNFFPTQRTPINLHNEYLWNQKSERHISIYIKKKITPKYSMNEEINTYCDTYFEE